MRVVLKLAVGNEPGADAAAVLATARQAEDAGFHGIALSDHVALGRDTSAYHWGDFAFPPDVPWLEPLTMLAAMAARTTTIRLCTAILIAPLRPAALLAKTVATLDQLSDGRLELGVGTGWQAKEFEAVGVDYEARGRILTDTIAACRVLWTSSPASFASETITFDDVWVEPKPVRPGGPPILFAGTLTPRTRRRIVELGDGWIPITGASVGDIHGGTAMLREELRAAGRDPSALRVRVPVPILPGADGEPCAATSLDAVGPLADAGANEFLLRASPFLPDPTVAEPWFAAMAAHLERLGGTP